MLLFCSAAGLLTYMLWGLVLTSLHDLIWSQSIRKSPKSLMKLLQLQLTDLHSCQWLWSGIFLSLSLFLSTSLICLMIRGIAELADCHFQLQWHWCISFPSPGSLLVWLRSRCSDTRQGGFGLIAALALFLCQTGAHFIIFTLFIKSLGRGCHVAPLEAKLLSVQVMLGGSYCCFYRLPTGRSI